MTGETFRTFIAVDIPAGVKKRLDAAVEPVRRQVRLSWTKPTGWHLTLKFLGDLTADEVERVSEAAQHAAAECTPFTLSLEGWGAFPSCRRPRVLWVGVKEGREQVSRAAGLLEDELVHIGHSREKRRFHAHLTLARVKSPDAGSRAVHLLEEKSFSSEPFPVDRLIVYRSVLKPSGAEYTALSTAYMG